MPRRVAAIAVSIFLLSISPGWADDVQTQIEAARVAYAKGDGLKAMTALQAASGAIGQRLFDQFARALPPPSAGWEAAPAEFQALDTIGGGLSVTRGYSKESATLNASLIVDNPAVTGSSSLFDGAKGVAAQPGWSRISVNGEEALLRYDASTRAGEVLILVGNRALLQIEGNDIANANALSDAAKGWNVAAIRKLLGV